eukprot:TRINITY_DN4501_c0_g1_i1.p1 TRINITY_DN4501_c0_g1~~TRINITY_DN4501_c0_g1_i1.p1  ORF type:complete len:150 (-),score=16.10 TRINITY_DN4501_c0_g1_i1:169-618(-)
MKFVLLLLLVAILVPMMDAFRSRYRAQRVSPKRGYNAKKPKWLQKEEYVRKQEAGEDWSRWDMQQIPIDDDQAHRKVNRALGSICSFSTDCGSGCCLMDRQTKIRSCQAKSTRGQKCSSAQVKSDLYVDACPCEAGNDFCPYPSEVCSA